MQLNKLRQLIKQKNKEDLKYQIDKLNTLSEYHKTKEDVLKWVTYNILNKRADYQGDYFKQEEYIRQQIQIKDTGNCTIEFNYIQFLKDCGVE